jgi:hypothetical protein
MSFLHFFFLGLSEIARLPDVCIGKMDFYDFFFLAEVKKLVYSSKIWQRLDPIQTFKTTTSMQPQQRGRRYMQVVV